jgi:hypothetical protein
MWVLANGLLIHDWLGDNPFDPFPFILLNLLRLEGIVVDAARCRRLSVGSDVRAYASASCARREEQC